MSNSSIVVAVCALTIAAVLLRPRRIPEWVWSVAGAIVLLLGRLLPWAAALHALRDGLDVYLFLGGMLVIAEIARVAGVFDWLAARVVPVAKGSQGRLFAGVYAVGIAVTAFLSNDATILLLTPAVLSAIRRADADPLPYAYACAFVANAASFVLPISNPANLVLFRTLPAAGPWLASFGPASLLAVAATFAAMLLLQRRFLRKPCAAEVPPARLDAGGRLAAVVVAGCAAVLVLATVMGWPLGVSAAILGALALLLVSVRDPSIPKRAVAEAPWGIVPFVAGLFILVAALDRSGIMSLSRGFVRFASSLPELAGNLFTGSAVTIADTVLNNLPAGVLARYSLDSPAAAPHIAHAALVGIDLGPNLSVSGSLATILWLLILRREQIEVTAGQFFKLGAVVTLPALALSLAAVR